MAGPAHSRVSLLLKVVSPVESGERETTENAVAQRLLLVFQNNEIRAKINRMGSLVENIVVRFVCQSIRQSIVVKFRVGFSLLQPPLLSTTKHPAQSHSKLVATMIVSEKIRGWLSTSHSGTESTTHISIGNFNTG